MIEMVRDLIMGILGLIKKGEFKQASDGIERIYVDILRQDSGFFQTIPPEKLTQTLIQEHNYNNGHLEILAELLNAEAELDLAQVKKKEALGFSQKSLILFEFIDNEQKTYSTERLAKIEAIRKRILTLQSELKN